MALHDWQRGKISFFVPPPQLLSKFFDIMYTIFWNLDTKMSETTYSWTYLQWSFIWPSVCRSIMQVLNFLDWNIFLIEVLTISNKKYLCIIYQLYVVAKHGPRDVNHFSTCSVSLFYIWVSGRAIVHFSLFRVAFQVLFLVVDSILCKYTIIDFGKK